MSTRTLGLLALALVVVLGAAYFAFTRGGRRETAETERGARTAGRVTTPTPPPAPDAAAAERARGNPAAPTDERAEAAARTAAAQGRATESTGGTIRGRVLTPEGAPIGNATIECRRRIEPDGFEAAATAESDADGSFRVVDLAPGEYAVRARARRRRPASAPTVTLGAREESDEIRLVLAEGLAISGRVRDDRGRPVEGATVTTVPPGAVVADPTSGALENEAAATTAETAKTDEAGAFEIDGLPDGKFDLVANAERHDDERRRGVAAGAEEIEIVLPRIGKIVGRVVDGRGAPVSPVWVAVRQDLRSYDVAPPSTHRFENAEGKFVLEKRRAGIHDLFVMSNNDAPAEVPDVEVNPDAEPEEVLVRLPRPGRIVGRVKLEDGTPVAGASIAAIGDLPPLPDDEPWYELVTRSRSSSPKDPHAVVYTGADGAFALEKLRPGTHEILVHAKGRGSIATPSVDVAEGGTTGPVEVVLPKGGSIAGRVTDAKGAGVTGSIVWTLPHDAIAKEASVRWRNATTKAGDYRVDDLSPGRYMVVLANEEELGGDRPPKMQTTQVSSGEVARVDFGGSPKGATLVGEVEDADGKPVPGAQVVLFHFGKVGSEMKSAFADRKGEYRIEELGPGPYGVYFGRGASFTSVLLGMVTIADSPTEVRYDITVPGGSIAGRIADARTGKGISGATVTLLTTLGPSPEFPGGFTVSDEKGEYRLGDLVPRGYRISATAAGYGQETSERFTLAADDARSGVDLALEAGGSLLLVALDQEGRGLTGALIVFNDATGKTVAIGTPAPWLDANSSIAAEGVKPGKYYATVLKDGDVAASGAFEIRAGERTETTIRGVAAQSTDPATEPPR